MEVKLYEISARINAIQKQLNNATLPSYEPPKQGKKSVKEDPFQ